MASNTLHWSDYLIFAFCLVGSLVIGLYHAFTGGKQKTTAEYLTGNRKLNFFATSISLVVTFFSAILVVGAPVEPYLYGAIFWLAAVAWSLAAISSMFVFLPVFYPLKLTSVNKYLELRFNSQLVKILGTLAQIANMFGYTATVFFVPATAINTLIGFDTNATLIIGSIIAILYTSLGGIKAVIYVDLFQAVLMISGMLAITFRSVALVGGFGEMWATCSDWNRFQMSYDPDPRVRYTFWSMMIGGSISQLYKYGCHQASVQRYCSMATMAKARLVLLFVVPWTALSISLACLTGLAIFSFYASIGCDPYAGGFLQNTNQIVPRFIGDVLTFPGLQGLLLAALASGSLSTASSTLNSASANIFHDLIAPYWPKMSERKNVIITKGLVVLCGGICTAMAFGVKELGSTIIKLAGQFTGACGGPSLSMFVMGMFLPFTNWIGVSVGGCGGFAFAMWVTIGNWRLAKRHPLPTPTLNCTAYGRDYLGKEPHTTVSSMFVNTTMASTIDYEPFGVDHLYLTSFKWIATFSLLFSLVLGIIVSLLSGGWSQDRVPANLLHPIVRKFYRGGPDVQPMEKDTKIRDVNDETKVVPSNGYLGNEKLGGHDNMAYISKM